MSGDGGMLWRFPVESSTKRRISDDLHQWTPLCVDYPRCEAIGTIADYLGVGTGVLEVDPRFLRLADTSARLHWSPLTEPQLCGTGEPA